MSLKEQIAEAGNKLLQPPSSVDELLPLLDQVESSLSKVEQSPGQYMDDALSPLKEAMVANDLLRHSDIDVKAAVASCISEITRITAPDAPYDDDKMKDVFQLIISSFENLHDQTSRSYNKRVLILETVAKVKSFNFMLDLECNRLITEMFQHFLKAIRDYHTVNILSYMVAIMTCVLEESEEVSLELLSPLLASVKKDKEVTPAAKWLGETVFENCAAKLKPCLKKAVESLHISLAEYSNIVTLVLEGALPAVDHVSDTVSKDLLAAESKLADLPEAVQATQEPETTHQQSAPKESKGQAVNVAPSSPGQSQPDENITKKAAQSKKESLNKEDSVFKKGSEATSDIEAEQARRPLKKALLETSHKENEGGSSSNTEAKKQKQSVEQMQCPRVDGEVNTRKRVKKPPQRADDEFKTRKLVEMPVKTKVEMPVETRIKKPVEIRKWLSFPLLVAGLRAKDEMAISQFKDLLLIEWSVRTSILTDFSEKLKRARCRKKKSIAAKFLQIIFDDCAHWPETSDLVLIGPKLKAQFETLLCSKKFTSLGLVFAGVWSDQADLQVLAILRFRELFKDRRCPPKRLIINSGVIPRFDEFLGKEDSPILQRVAALALVDITSEMAYSIEDLMNHKLVEILIKILDIQDFYVRKKAVSQLGNIAELPEGRDFVHRHEVVRLLVENFFSPLLWLMGFVENYKYPKMLRMANYKYLKMLRIATYTLLRLCKGASRPDVDETENKYGSMIVYTPAELMSNGRHLEKVKEALPVLVQLVDLSDEEVLINACSVLACLTDNTYWKTKVEINDSTCARLVQLLVHESPSVVTPALRTLGNIVARDDNLSKCIVDFGALPLLCDLLSKSIEEVEVWRTIANITKRTPIQIEEKQKLKVKENLDKSGMVKLSLLCDELGIPYPIATPRKEDIVAKLMNFLDPYAMTSDHEREESREGKKRRRESAEQMSQEDIVAKLDFLDAARAIMTSELLDEKEESREVKKRRRESAEDAPSDDELFCAIGEIFKEVDITKEINFTDILERLCKRFGTVLTRRKKYIPIMIEYQLDRIFPEDEDEDED